MKIVKQSYIRITFGPNANTHHISHPHTLIVITYFNYLSARARTIAFNSLMDCRRTAVSLG